MPQARTSLGPALIEIVKSGLIHQVPIWMFKKGLKLDVQFAGAVTHRPHLTASQIEALIDWVCRVCVAFALGREKRLSRTLRTIEAYRRIVGDALFDAPEMGWQASPRNAALLCRTLERRHENYQPLLIAGLPLRAFSAEEIQRHYRAIGRVALKNFGCWRQLLDRVAEHPGVPANFLLAQLKASDFSPWEMTAFTIREEVRRDPDVRAEMLDLVRRGDSKFLPLLCKEASREELPELMNQLVECLPTRAIEMLENPSDWPRNLTIDALAPALMSRNSNVRLAAIRVLAYLNSQEAAAPSTTP